MKVKTWNIEMLTGYKPKTTYYEDFSIADNFGVQAIKDTYKRAMETAETMGVVYLTELVMALNWKIWEHNERNDIYAKVYNDLWQQADNYAIDTLKGDDLVYFYNTTD